MAHPWPLHERFPSALPTDPDPSWEPHLVVQAVCSFVEPDPVARPELAVWSRDVAPLVGLAEEPRPGLAAVLAGNEVPEGARPWAAAYGGHQFGHWAGQLGDGRAITLGEAEGADGVWREVQLKGAGRTPYSRGGDGRAVLRSSVRELLCSEAMHHLGIPTTRALSLCTTGETVRRDMFYDGRPQDEPGAVVCRVAPTFLRFGSFELFAARRDLDTLRALVDHTLRTHFPAIDPEGGDDSLVAWLHDVAQRTLQLVVHWQRVGFVHGVLNTDNLSILGLTLDYGPYGWLDDFDPDFTPNTSDPQGRYRYSHQPGIGAWNLARLMEAVGTLMEEPARLQPVLDGYTRGFGPAFLAMMRGKLGLVSEEADDGGLIDDLFDLLTASPTDHTRLFRRLGDLPVQEGADRVPAIRSAFYDGHASEAGWGAWLDRYAARVRADAGPASDRRARMNRVNPSFVLRNHLVFRALELATEGDFAEVHTLHEVLRDPYADLDPAHARFDELRPAWAREQPGCSTLSCSS